MIEAKVYKDGNKLETELRIDGTRKEVFFEFAHIARNLHDSLLKSDPDAAVHFREFTKELFSDREFWSISFESTESCFIDMSRTERGGPT